MHDKEHKLKSSFPGEHVPLFSSPDIAFQLKNNNTVLQTMEPISPDGQDGSRLQKFTDDELDKLLRDLNEFQKTSIEDVVDTFLTGNINSWDVAHSPQSHFTKVLHDFEDYETQMLPPCQKDSEATGNFCEAQSFTFAPGIQDCQMMIEEMAEESQYLDLENFQGSTPGLNMAPDILSCWDLEGIYGLGTDPLGSSTSSVSFQGTGPLSMSFFGAPHVRYFRCKENHGVNEKAIIRSRRKRKYRGVIETEEETARRLERTRIKNREAAAKAHHDKQAHEDKLKAKLLRLRKKNKFLRNFLMFLEDDKGKGFSPMPLRRTISGPM